MILCQARRSISVISFYSVIFKGCLLYIVASTIGQRRWAWFQQERPLHDMNRFDDAREVVGSIHWLFWKPWADPITTFGVLVIVTILIDPFVQQLIDYRDCSVNVTQVATIPRTNYSRPVMVHARPLSRTPLPPKMTAFNAGIFSVLQSSHSNATPVIAPVLSHSPH
jgi:hypothetical protein